MLPLHFSLGKRCKDTLGSFTQVLPHTMHISPSILNCLEAQDPRTAKGMNFVLAQRKYNRKHVTNHTQQFSPWKVCTEFSTPNVRDSNSMLKKILRLHCTWYFPQEDPFCVPTADNGRSSNFKMQKLKYLLGYISIPKAKSYIVRDDQNNSI